MDTQNELRERLIALFTDLSDYVDMGMWESFDGPLESLLAQAIMSGDRRVIESTRDDLRVVQDQINEMLADGKKSLRQSVILRSLSDSISSYLDILDAAFELTVPVELLQDLESDITAKTWLGKLFLIGKPVVPKALEQVCSADAFELLQLHGLIEHDSAGTRQSWVITERGIRAYHALRQRQADRERAKMIEIFAEPAI